MATLKKLSAETLQLFVGNGLSLVLGLLISIIVTRALGDIARGAFAWVFTLQGLGCQVAAIVTYQAARQLAARHPEADWPRLAATIAVLCFAGSALALPFLIYGLLEPDVGAHYTTLLLIAFAVVPFSAAAAALSALLHTRAELGPTLLTISAQRVFTFAGVVVLLALGGVTLHTLTWLNFAAPLVVLALIWYFLKLPLAKPDWHLWRELKRFLGATWLAGLALFAMPKLALVMLGSSGQLAATGHYSVATTLFEAGLILPMLAGSVLISHFTRTESGAAARRKTTLVLLGVSSTMAIGGALIGPWLVPLLFGADFVAAVVPFQILMVALVLAALHQAWFSRLVAAHQHQAMLWPPLVGCSAVVALGWVLVPLHGATGTALATLGGYAVMVLLTYTLKKTL